MTGRPLAVLPIVAMLAAVLVQCNPQQQPPPLADSPFNLRIICNANVERCTTGVSIAGDCIDNQYALGKLRPIPSDIDIDCVDSNLSISDLQKKCDDRTRESGLCTMPDCKFINGYVETSTSFSCGNPNRPGGSNSGRPVPGGGLFADANAPFAIMSYLFDATKVTNPTKADRMTEIGAANGTPAGFDARDLLWIATRSPNNLIGLDIGQQPGTVKVSAPVPLSPFAFAIGGASVSMTSITALVGHAGPVKSYRTTAPSTATNQSTAMLGQMIDVAASPIFDTGSPDGVGLASNGGSGGVCGYITFGPPTPVANEISIASAPSSVSAGNDEFWVATQAGEVLRFANGINASKSPLQSITVAGALEVRGAETITDAIAPFVVVSVSTGQLRAYHGGNLNDPIPTIVSLPDPPKGLEVIVQNGVQHAFVGVGSSGTYQILRYNLATGSLEPNFTIPLGVLEPLGLKIGFPSENPAKLPGNAIPFLHVLVATHR